MDTYSVCETLKTTERLIHDFRVHRHILLCICLVPTSELVGTGVIDLFFESASDLTSVPSDRLFRSNIFSFNNWGKSQQKKSVLFACTRVNSECNIIILYNVPP